MDSRLRTNFAVSLASIESDGGLVGYGAGNAMPGFEGYEDLSIGCDPLDMVRHYAVIENQSLHLGKCWPLDITLWGLAGKIRGEPVWRMLGGTKTPIPVYASLGQKREREVIIDTALAVMERDFMPARPIVANGTGCVHLGEAPGLGFDLDPVRLYESRL